MPRWLFFGCDSTRHSSAFHLHRLKVGTLLSVGLYCPVTCQTAPPPPLPLLHHCGVGCLSGILRELVGEFTLSTNVSATTTSMLRTLFDVDMGMVLEAWSRETDQQALEQQVPSNASSVHAGVMRYQLC